MQFEKSFAVLEELFASPVGREVGARLEAAGPEGFRFLDLGASPGGFSAFLLSLASCGWGVGVSLPAASGFPMLIGDDQVAAGRYYAHFTDLLDCGPYELTSALGGRRVHLCLCDAQDLGQQHGPSWNSRGFQGQRRPDTYVEAKVKSLGIWALLFRQLGLSLARLEDGGCLIFRFSWVLSIHDAQVVEGDWGYYEASLRLMGLLSAAFGSVGVFKSSAYHTSDSTCYVVCSGFHRAEFEDVAEPFRGVGPLFVESARDALACEDMGELPSVACLQALPRPGAAEVSAIRLLLEKVTLLREIGRTQKGLSDGKRFADVQQAQQHQVGGPIGRDHAADPARLAEVVEPPGALRASP